MSDELHNYVITLVHPAPGQPDARRFVRYGDVVRRHRGEIYQYVDRWNVVFPLRAPSSLHARLVAVEHDREARRSARIQEWPVITVRAT